MSALFRSGRRLLGQPDFVAVFLLLAAAALSLNFITTYLKLHYRKEPVPLRARLDDADQGIPSRLGAWVQVSKDVPIPPDTEHVLGTSQYLFRWYVDTSKIDPDVLSRLDEMSTDQRGALLGRIQQAQPDAVINVGITYYTGLVDTVAHIPDRCMLGNGFEVTDYQIEKNQDLGICPDGKRRVLSFRFINFDDPSGRDRGARDVAYFFHVNGHYECNPLEVRWRLQDLRERFGYYAKVELMMVGDSRDAAAQQRAMKAIKAFMAELLPPLEHCLPDWQQVHARTAPADGTK
jgi:hypothetical protein